ncbi:hypothetical protein NE237_030996 [Protea cynaroides]|uniref:Uncharacterized protein n=1 Tax=Protea cynaroides TaxID=273540 RepID=A0A9Q0GV64_9MAGN|nr:hypothetical protein NE237_030996 [Protea cynaroides]
MAGIAALLFHMAKLHSSVKAGGGVASLVATKINNYLATKIGLDVQIMFLELSPGGTANVEERSIIERGWFSYYNFPIDFPRLEWRNLMRIKDEIVIFNVLSDCS